MGVGKINIIYRLLIVVILLSGQACYRQIPTFKEWSSHLIGMNINVLREINARNNSYVSRSGWEEKTYTLDNGNWVYVFPDSKDCIVHAEVNQEGIIVGFKTEGQHCK